MKRFWVLGPVRVNDKEFYGVVDGYDMPGQRPAIKPTSYREFWPNKGAANAHAEALNHLR